MLKEFLSSQLFSVIIGSVLTLIVSSIMSKKNVSSSLEEEISKERIRTYKTIFKLICQLNHNLSYATNVKVPKSCFIGYIRAGEKEYHKGYCFPSVFLTFEEFGRYKSTFSIILNDNRIFLDQAITNKLSFLDSYLSQIWHLAYGKNDAFLHMIGFTLSNEISELVQELENEIIKFINTGNKKKIKNNFSNTYFYEYQKKNDTELNNWFVENNVSKFGDFPLCSNCEHCDNCPLNKIINDEAENI